MKPSARRKARRLALQAIYQWQFTNHSITDIDAQFCETINPNKVDITYFSELLKGVSNNITNIDAQMLPFLDRPIKDLNLVELAILRIAIYELIYRSDIPYKVIINEALETAKTFGTETGFKYINGILDKVAKNLTPKT